MNFFIVTLILMWKKFLGQCEKLLPMKEDLIQEVHTTTMEITFPLKKVLAVDFLSISLLEVTSTAKP